MTVIVSFPRGCIVDPLTALGTMGDGMRLSGCSFSCWSKEGPAMEMSAPESGSAVTIASPLRADMCAVMVGAGSICCVEAMYAWGYTGGPA